MLVAASSLASRIHERNCSRSEVSSLARCCSWLRSAAASSARRRAASASPSIRCCRVSRSRSREERDSASARSLLGQGLVGRCNAGCVCVCVSVLRLAMAKGSGSLQSTHSLFGKPNGSPRLRTAAIPPQSLQPARLSATPSRAAAPPAVQAARPAPPAAGHGPRPAWPRAPPESQTRAAEVMGVGGGGAGSAAGAFAVRGQGDLAFGLHFGTGELPCCATLGPAAPT